MRGRTNPFEELERMFDRMSGRFDPQGDQGWLESYDPIPVDVVQSDDEIVVTADIPGCQKEHVNVRVLDEDTLQIAVDYHHAEDVAGDKYVRRERNHRHANRTIDLPARVDEEQVRARCNNGVLTITLPLSTEGDSERRIEITG